MLAEPPANTLSPVSCWRRFTKKKKRHFGENLRADSTSVYTKGYTQYHDLFFSRPRQADKLHNKTIVRANEFYRRRWSFSELNSSAPKNLKAIPNTNTHRTTSVQPHSHGARENAQTTPFPLITPQPIISATWRPSVPCAQLLSLSRYSVP